MNIENIKFKAKIGNVWEYGYPIKCADGWGFFVESRYEEGATLVDNKETICQYIGLHDKNGVEIYEGDIIDAWSTGQHVINGVVSWGAGPCQFFIFTKVAPHIFNFVGDKDGFDKGVIVVGNIYDNPELLKQ